MYMYSFHWILLCIMIDHGSVIVLDPKKYPVSDYQDLIDLLQQAWAHFRSDHPGVCDRVGDLIINTTFPVWLYIIYASFYLSNTRKPSLTNFSIYIYSAWDRRKETIYVDTTYATSSKILSVLVGKWHKEDSRYENTTNSPNYLILATYAFLI